MIYIEVAVQYPNVMGTEVVLAGTSFCLNLNTDDILRSSREQRALLPAESVSTPMDCFAQNLSNLLWKKCPLERSSQEDMCQMLKLLD